MTPEQRTASTPTPRWLRLLLAVVSAIAVFRVGTLILGFVLWLMRGTFFPLFIQEFLHRWDTMLVPLTSVAAAVLSSRWIEAKLANRNVSTSVVASLAFAAVALCPFTVRFESQPVMASPLLVAMQSGYSLETIEAILDRYPHLANASEDEWGDPDPLVQAAYERRTNLVQLLIRKGADVDAAVQTLMQLDAQEAVMLVLKSSETRKQDGAANSTQPIHSETNRTSSAAGSSR